MKSPNSIDSRLNKTVVNVSLIVPNFNNGKYLVEFLESILNATVLPVELIIVDDGSEDNSRQVLEKYIHLPFLKPVFFEENKGLTAALNAALDVAEGKFIMRADPDDILLPTKIEKQISYLEDHPEIDVVGCNVAYFSDVDGSIVNESNFPLIHEEICERYWAGEHGLQHPTVCARAEVYQHYRYQKIFPAEDYEIFSRMVKDGRRFANLKESLYKMRVHPGSSTSNIRFSDIEQTFRFRDQIFKTRTSEKQMMSYYRYIKNYRSFQLSKNIVSKLWYLMVASYHYPQKVLRRIRR